MSASLLENDDEWTSASYERTKAAHEDENRSPSDKFVGTLSAFGFLNDYDMTTNCAKGHSTD